MLAWLLSKITLELSVLLTAAMPIVELRGAIPVGVALGMAPLYALLISLVGSMIPVPFILLLIKPIFTWMKSNEMFGNLVHKITHKTLSKGDQVKKYEFWGLLVFVAIPLPGTGVWSGALLASLLDIEIKKSFSAILIGNIIAGCIITILSYGVVSLV